jgi:hypothetical protein
VGLKSEIGDPDTDGVFMLTLGVVNRSPLLKRISGAPAQASPERRISDYSVGVL